MSRDGLSNPVTSIPNYAAAMLSVCSSAVMIDDVPPSVLTRSVASPPTPPPPQQNQPRLRTGGRGAEQRREPLSRIDNVLQRHKNRTAADESHASGAAALKSSSISAAANAVAGTGLSNEAREVLELELRMERLEFMCKQQEQQQKQQHFGILQSSSDQASALVSLNSAAGAMCSHVSPVRTLLKDCVRYHIILRASSKRLAITLLCFPQSTFAPFKNI
jgi:hypothetical protein